MEISLIGNNCSVDWKTSWSDSRRWARRIFDHYGGNHRDHRNILLYVINLIATSHRTQHVTWLVLLLPNSHAAAATEWFQCFGCFMMPWCASFETIPKKLHFSQLKLYETKCTEQNGAIKFQMTLWWTSFTPDKINDQSIDAACMCHHRWSAN